MIQLTPEQKQELNRNAQIEVNRRIALIKKKAEQILKASKVPQETAQGTAQGTAPLPLRTSHKRGSGGGKKSD